MGEQLRLFPSAIYFICNNSHCAKQNGWNVRTTLTKEEYKSVGGVVLCPKCGCQMTREDFEPIVP